MWDAGTVAGNKDCIGGSQNRLEGIETGDADTLVVVVSAGPDKSFDTANIDKELEVTSGASFGRNVGVAQNNEVTRVG